MRSERGAPGLSGLDPEVAEAITLELERERRNLNLIGSENYAPLAVLDAQGSILTNKYAEGYPGKRYYSGCGPVDLAETLAVDRAKKLFGCEHANVQPHSGSQANMAVYMAVLEPGDTLMAMDLSCGGHLTHGTPFNFSGTIYRGVHYGVDRETETLDYESIAELALRERPGLIVAGGSSYTRAIDFEAFRRIADDVGAVLMVDMAHFAGLVVGKLHPDPVPYSDFVTGTTHKTMRGPRGGFVLSRRSYRERLDSAVFPGMQGGPLMHVVVAKAVCFNEAMKPEFSRYQRNVVENARALCEKIASEGFRVVSGGTETHLILIDLRPEGITGREAEDILNSVNIDVNMNEVPYDEAPATVTGGIRIGTPAVTTRGMGPEQMEIIGGLVSRALKDRQSEVVLEGVRSAVRELVNAFPLYPELR